MSPEPVPPPPTCRGCDCGEPLAPRVEKGDEAFRAGEYETAAELFRSALAGLARPDRGLCLRLGDALARAGRLPEALGAFRGAARLGALRPDELGELASGLACVPGPRERRSPVGKPGRAPGEAPSGEPSASVPAAPRDLLDCPRCQRLLHKPVTLPCGLTVCRRCAEPGPGRPPVRRVNVVLSGLLEKCFPAECRARRLAGQVQSLQSQQQPEAALLRCHQALDLGKRARGLAHLHARLLRGRAGTGELGLAGGALVLSGGGEAKSRGQLHLRAVFSRTSVAFLSRPVRPALLFTLSQPYRSGGRAKGFNSSCREMQIANTLVCYKKVTLPGYHKKIAL